MAVVIGNVGVFKYLDYCPKLEVIYVFLGFEGEMAVAPCTKLFNQISMDQLCYTLAPKAQEYNRKAVKISTISYSSLKYQKRNFRIEYCCFLSAMRLVDNDTFSKCRVANHLEYRHPPLTFRRQFLLNNMTSAI